MPRSPCISSCTQEFTLTVPADVDSRGEAEALLLRCRAERHVQHDLYASRRPDEPEPEDDGA